MTEREFLDIVNTLIEMGKLDISRIFDEEYVIERVKIYVEARDFVREHFKGCF